MCVVEVGEIEPAVRAPALLAAAWSRGEVHAVSVLSAETLENFLALMGPANLAFARATLTGSAASILAVEGGWYITLQVPHIHSEEEWTLRLLEREGVLVQPGYFYDFASEAYLVVSLLTAPEIFREGLARIAAAVCREIVPGP